MVSKPVLEQQEREGVLYLSLNRPEVKNAMDAELIGQLEESFRSLRVEQYRVVVLRGNGDFFCAGGDLNWMKSSMEKSTEENEKDALALARMIRAVDECPLPVITQVKGGAFGGGVGLVAASDIVIASDQAKFSLSEVKLGLIPATIGPLVMRKIGYSEARRLYLTGMRFPASEAHRMHLVHNVVPASSIHTVSVDYIRELGNAGPRAVQRAKALIREMAGDELWNPDISEKTSKVLSEVRVGEEAQEGMSAFLEKRKASWRKALLES